MHRYSNVPHVFALEEMRVQNGGLEAGYRLETHDVRELASVGNGPFRSTLRVETRGKPRR